MKLLAITLHSLWNRIALPSSALASTTPGSCAQSVPQIQEDGERARILRVGARRIDDEQPVAQCGLVGDDERGERQNERQTAVPSAPHA